MPLSISQPAVHWHTLVLFGPTRKAYLWEPATLPLTTPQRRAIDKAFEAAPKAAGWTLESIKLHLQDDGYHCGPWAHWCRCRALEYATQAMGGDDDRGFAHFLASSEGVQPMDDLSGMAKRRAGKDNGALMEALRGKLSVLLRTAHAKGLLPWACALHDEFRAEGTEAPVYIDLDAEE